MYLPFCKQSRGSSGWKWGECLGKYIIAQLETPSSRKINQRNSFWWHLLELNTFQSRDRIQCKLWNWNAEMNLYQNHFLSIPLKLEVAAQNRPGGLSHRADAHRKIQHFTLVFCCQLWQEEKNPHYILDLPVRGLHQVIISLLHFWRFNYHFNFFLPLGKGLC